MKLRLCAPTELLLKNSQFKGEPKGLPQKKLEPVKVGLPTKSKKVLVDYRFLRIQQSTFEVPADLLTQQLTEILSKMLQPIAQLGRSSGG